MDIKYELVGEAKTPVIKDFAKVKESLADFIKDAHAETVIEDDSAFKDYKKRRAVINNKQKEIASARIALNKSLLGTLNDQFKELEDELGKCEKTMKAKVDEYKAAKKQAESEKPETKLYTITVTAINLEDIQEAEKALSKKKGIKLTKNY